jgi:hypothetical protein
VGLETEPGECRGEVGDANAEAASLRIGLIGPLEGEEHEFGVIGGEAGVVHDGV